MGNPRPPSGGLVQLKRLKRSARYWFDKTVSTDLRGKTDDLLEGFRIAGRRKFILDVPLEKWRHNVPVGSVCTAETTDPLINTQVKALFSHPGFPPEISVSAI